MAESAVSRFMGMIAASIIGQMILVSFHGSRASARDDRLVDSGTGTAVAPMRSSSTPSKSLAVSPQ